MKRSDGLEAVTVCVGMDDLLHETVKWNLPHFDRYIVVTEPSDHATREVCRKFNLECLLTTDGKTHGMPFNKGRMIERALHMTSENAWRLHIDCDIALPHGFRHLVQTAELKNDSIYGADRIDVVGWQNWQKLQQSGFLNHSLDYHCRVQMPAGFQLGTRWAHPQMGYVPIGYFQLWKEDEWNGIRHKTYPVQHGNAARSDVQWALKFDRSQRGIIPELIVAHLMTKDTVKGSNWNGRKTERFGPPWNCKPTPEMGS